MQININRRPQTVANWLTSICLTHGCDQQAKTPGTAKDKQETGNTSKKPEGFNRVDLSANASSSDWNGFYQICKKTDHRIFRCRGMEKVNVYEKWVLVKRCELCMKCYGRHALRDCESETVCGTDRSIKSYIPRSWNWRKASQWVLPSVKNTKRSWGRVLIAPNQWSGSCAWTWTE